MVSRQSIRWVEDEDELKHDAIEVAQKRIG